MKYLITYDFRKYGKEHESNLCYTFEDSVEGFIERTQDHTDGIYFVINVLPVTNSFYNKYKSMLRGI
jgi:hypothetical protein